MATKRNYLINAISKLKEMPSKYLVVFNLGGERCSLIVSKQILDNIITWYETKNSSEYNIKKDNGYLKITKDILIAFSWKEISNIRQLAEPVIHIIKSPTKYNIKIYLKAILLISLFINLAMFSYVSFENIKLTKTFLINSLQVTMGSVNILNIGIVSVYILNILKRVIFLARKERLSTYVETISFRTRDSVIVNSISIIVLSIFLQKIMYSLIY